MKRALAALGGLTLLATASCQTNGTPIQLAIFHTNDIHSHVRAAKIDPFGLGGLARISTLLQTLRAQHPNSLTLDAGDWSEGTWYFDINEGSNMLELLDAMKYDAVALGNHDFLLGPDQIIKTIQTAAPSFPVLAANLDMSSYPNAAALQAVLPATAVKTVGGLKIGFIGLTTYGFLFNSYMAPVVITDTIAAATAAANTLRPNVDLLVIISHNDFTQNEEIAQAVPGVDVLISGHTHLKTPQAVIVQNAGRSVPVIETGCWGRFVGELDLSVDPTLKTVTIGQYQLHPVTPDIAEDPVIATTIDQQDSLLDAQIGDDINRVVAQSDFDLVQADAQESPLGTLATKAYRAYTGADVALEEISLTGVSIAQGPTTLMDLHDVVPHIYNPQTGKEWTLKLWSAKGSDLSLVLDIFYTLSSYLALSSPTGWLSADNAVVVWTPAGANGTGGTVPAVNSITIGGAPLDPNATYTVALTDGLLLGIQSASSGLGLNLDLSQITETGEQAWSAVVAYAAAQKELTTANLGVGGHVMTTGPDLGVFTYGIDWDGTTITVEVSNQGLQPSQAGDLVTCSSGINNDYADFDTTSQVWTTIGSAALPALAPGASAQVTITWSSSALASGYWPVQCQAIDPKDAYAPNNSAEHVFDNP